MKQRKQGLCKKAYMLALSMSLLVVLGTGLHADAQDMGDGGMQMSSEPPPADNASEGDTTTVNDNDTMSAEDTGVAVNGNANGSNINNNQNSLSTGNNTNMNLIAPNLYSPSSSNSQAGSGIATGGIATGGVGGNAVLMMPRNPLPLGNAAVGRSNFGLQFGLQNNPILGGLGWGKQNALGWFLQGGLTIPFGKIPDVYRNQQNNQMDEIREANLDRQRNVIGRLEPSRDSQGKNVQYKTRVNGKITGMGAYNYTTIPAGKIGLQEALNDASAAEARLSQPKLVALEPAEVFSKPLNIGDKIGVIEAGNEYPYLGHTRSGWVKILLPSGNTGWTSTHFEYLKNDYTEIDTLAVDPKVGGKIKTAVIRLPKQSKKASAQVLSSREVQ